MYCLCGGVLLSHRVAPVVPSALAGLASGFGMGPGVSPPPWPPQHCEPPHRTHPGGLVLVWSHGAPVVGGLWGVREPDSGCETRCVSFVAGCPVTLC